MILQRILMEQDPTGWRMLNGCIMLNLTRREQVDGVRDELFGRWPTAVKMCSADLGWLEEVIRPLGLQHRRALTLWKFSTWWCEHGGNRLREDLGQVDFRPDLLEAVRAMEPPGVGEYARDSWAIFVEGIVPDWEVNDHALLRHLRKVDAGLHGPYGLLRRPWEPAAHYLGRLADHAARDGIPTDA